MKEQQALLKMVAPGQRRKSIWREGVLQIWITRACDKKCFHCTQNSQMSGKAGFISVAQFTEALESLGFSEGDGKKQSVRDAYFGVVGMFGGNPALHPEFGTLCEILRDRVPFDQRGLWCNHPRSLANARIMEETFNPAVSNLNVHQDQSAWDMFIEGWPQSGPVLKGLDSDSRHGPPLVAMSDVIADESDRWDRIANCDINKYWSSFIGVFRGELRAWFCEIAGSHAMLHQNNTNYNGSGQPIPDTGLPVTRGWWKKPMQEFAAQVRVHCHGCGIPLKGFGQLANGGHAEQVSALHLPMVKLRDGRQIQVITSIDQVSPNYLPKATDYIENGGLT